MNDYGRIFGFKNKTDYLSIMDLLGKLAQHLSKQVFPLGISKCKAAKTGSGSSSCRTLAATPLLPYDDQTLDSYIVAALILFYSYHTPCF